MNARAWLSRSPSKIWLLAVLCATGCDDSLKSVSLIEETRVLGARIEVEADPQRSSPNPGERASLRFFLAAPDGQPRISYALSVCAVRLVNSGFPPCEGAPFASALETDEGHADARLDFQVPEDLAREATPHGFASGLICANSGLNLGPDGAASCVTGSGTQVAFEFGLAGPDQSNQSPTFASGAFSLDGEPWTATADATCDAGSLRRVTAKTRHALRVDLADSDFETLTQPTSVDPGRETLLVSPFSNAGELSNGFLSLGADTPPVQRAVSWDAPAINDALPRLVRFYFVVRDARAGEDFAERALCVLP